MCSILKMEKKVIHKKCVIPSRLTKLYYMFLEKSIYIEHTGAQGITKCTLIKDVFSPISASKDITAFVASTKRDWNKSTQYSRRSKIMARPEKTFAASFSHSI